MGTFSAFQVACEVSLCSPARCILRVGTVGFIKRTTVCIFTWYLLVGRLVEQTKVKCHSAVFPFDCKDVILS